MELVLALNFKNFYGMARRGGTWRGNRMIRK